MNPTRKTLAAAVAALLVSGGAWAQAAATPEQGTVPGSMRSPSAMEPARIEPSTNTTPAPRLPRADRGDASDAVGSTPAAPGAMGTPRGVGTAAGSNADGNTGTSMGSDISVDIPPNATNSAELNDPTALPEEQTYGNVTFVTGGVNYEQLPAIKEARSEYPLGIELYQKNGAKSEFTADADVKVVNTKSGNVVLETKAEGPFVLAKVPPGTYRVEASLNGETRKSKPLQVSGKKHTRAMIIFPEGTD
jgi:hypothetical protein